MDGLWLRIFLTMKKKFDRKTKLEKNLNDSDDSDFGYFLECDLKYQDNIKHETKKFSFYSRKKIILMNLVIFWKISPDTPTQIKKLICKLSDKKNYLIQ